MSSESIHNLLFELTQKADRATRSYRFRFRGWLPKATDSRILDLGCGDGKILWYLGKKYSYVHGVDLDSQKLDIAKSMGVSVQCQDVFEFLSTTNKTFDLICALDLVEHLGKNRIPTFLELCFKKLNSGGRIILQMPNPLSPFGFSVQQGDLTHEFTLAPVLTRKLLEIAGFNQCHWRETGPSLWGYSLGSTFRFCLWRLIRLGYRFLHFIEAGEKENFPLTRVYLVSALKP